MPYNPRRGYVYSSRPSPYRTYNARPARQSGNRRKETIHPSRFIKAAQNVEEIPYEPTHVFGDFALHEVLRRNIDRRGFTTPSPIQDQAIPAGLVGQDVIGIANTGTGKTLAFALPLLQRLIVDRTSRALIMAPTRELAQQIEQECRQLAKGSGLFGALLIGGAAMNPQLIDLKVKPQIIIGTPGRIKDHLERGSLTLDNVNIVVLDEVDRMLDMGFVNDMRFILRQLAPVRQSFFFSATLNTAVNNLIRTFSSDPVTISVKTGETADGVEQNIVTYGSHTDKIEKLHDLLIDQAVTKALIFDETQRSVERLSRELHDRGFKVDAIHGGKTQGQRQKALNRFKANDITILVATDVAARGIDVSDISHVINFSTPQSYVDYVHRIGRAGRAGRTGHALTFVDSSTAARLVVPSR
ncbi:MAG TPA: DEAD/DEAH box helicase [Candidatus Saccharimonadales bacterium]|nr:DEAD/DEAH box helicase [Candidatus Saccharimonadales bacterium]